MLADDGQRLGSAHPQLTLALNHPYDAIPGILRVILSDISGQFGGRFKRRLSSVSLTSKPLCPTRQRRDGSLRVVRRICRNRSRGALEYNWKQFKSGMRGDETAVLGLLQRNAVSINGESQPIRRISNLHAPARARGVDAGVALRSLYSCSAVKFRSCGRFGVLFPGA